MSRRPTSTDLSPDPETTSKRPQRTRLDDVAGHRVTRRFAVGTRATLLLAHASAHDADEQPPAHLLKVFHPGVSMHSVDVEITALGSSNAPHIVRLLDVASIEKGEPPCLVLERLPGPSLAVLLNERDSLTAGEAVTILAPLCAAVNAMHDAGVTHGALHLRRIVFDQRGAPVLTGFGRGVVQRRLPADSHDPDWRAAVLDDHRDLLDIVEEVLLQVEPRHASEAAPDLAALSHEVGAGPGGAFLTRLERLLFAWAPAETITISSRPHSRNSGHADTPSFSETDDGGVSTAPVAGFDWSDPAPASSSHEVEHRVISALRVLGASSSVLDIASSFVDAVVRFSDRRHARPDTSRPVRTPAPSSRRRRVGRRPVLVGTACAVLATTALLLVLPPTREEARAGVTQPTSSSSSASQAPVSETHAAPDTTAEARPGGGHAGPEPVLGDDPVTALQELSSIADGCSASPDVDACLARVYEPDYLADFQSDEAPTAIDAANAIVTGSWGGSALVAAGLNGQPASFLLMKGEAGWIVRDVFVSDQ
jgi:hypothetical protein